RALVRAFERADRQDAALEGCVCALRDDVRFGEESPNVDDRLTAKVEVAIGRVRRAQDEQIAAPDHVVEGKQFGVGGYERIGGQHPGGQTREGLLELVAERRTGIVDVCLEGHAEQADRHPREIIAAAQIITDVQRQPFVDQHGGIAEAELVLGKGGELHGVLHQAWAGREARRWNFAGGRVVALHGVKDLAVIEAGRLGDEVEFVRRRELDVAVSVAEQFGELRLAGRYADELGGDGGKELRCLLLRRGRRAADDLRGFLELLDAVSLHHALRAESELEVAALAPEIGMEPVGRAGEYGRAQDKELPVGEMRQQRIDAILHHLANGIEELVDRRADGDDNRRSWRNIRRRGGEYEPILLERPHEQLFAAVFDERQAARSQRLKRVSVEVVHVHAVARLGE